MNEIADGEIHPLNDDLAYILEYVDSDLTISDFDNKRISFLKKYVEYLLLNDADQCIRILIRHFYFSENFPIIYREPWMSSILAHKGTIAAKFQRTKNDNLGNPDDN